MQIQFPPSFLWGVALSSYQCEGNNINSDWYLWEQERHLEACGPACDHYRLFERDFQLAQHLKLNSVRFSLEWARIASGPLIFQEKEIDHYREVVDTLLKLNLKPLITLHHFTNPLWFNKNGGWLRAKNIDYFLAYLKKIVELLKDKVDFWLIFNEPLVYIYQGFIQGVWPPGKKNLKKAKRALANILEAYCTGYEEIKRIYQGSSPVSVSLTKHLRVFSGCPSLSYFLNSLAAFLRNRYFNCQLLDYLKRKNKLDFIALNYYCKEYTQYKGLVGRECSHPWHPERKNQLGWNIYPQGLYQILIKLKKYQLPIIVTENGTAEIDNSLYEIYLIQHLKAVARALGEGINIGGYFWWSLLDNFEWDKGFKYRFGLVEVDYNTFKRTIRPFAYTYAKICQENKIDI